MFIMDLLMDEEPWLQADDICDMVPRANQDARSPAAEIKDAIENLPKKDQKQVLRSFRKAFHGSQTIRHLSDVTPEMIQTLLNSKPTMEKVRRRGRRQANELEEFVGRYHHFAYGNLSITLDEEQDELNMAYGPEATFTLARVTDLVFSASGEEPFWHLGYTVTFFSDGDIIDRVSLSFDAAAPPTFVRDQTDAEAPPPPELCG